MRRVTDEQLRAALRHREYLARRLAGTDAQIATMNARWSKERGYCTPLRVEALRREVGA